MKESYLENRPWGSFRKFTDNEKTTVKILSIKAGGILSLQAHENRDEFWYILSGNPIITIGGKEEVSNPGDEYRVQRGAKHRIAGGEVDSRVLEIAYGYFDEKDIIRYEDFYGRN